jgi:hypothetical protein
MFFQFPETARKGDMLFPRDILISKKEDSVLKQQILDFCEQRCISRRIPQVHTGHLGTNASGQSFYFNHERYLLVSGGNFANSPTVAASRRSFTKP